MRVILASSEAVPFSKTGGLADVSTALSKALAAVGHDVWLVIPHYRRLQAERGVDPSSLESLDCRLEIPIASHLAEGTVFRTELPDSNATVLLIDQPIYFDRGNLYQENGKDYKDNCERYVFFSRAVLEAARQLNLRPDVIHANDWQTGLIPALVNIENRNSDGFDSAGVVYTIHNISFQGQFWHWDMELTGLDWKYFNWRQMEFFGHLNLLKTGIVFADMITTVSPTYAREIQTPEFGCGLEAVLAGRRDNLVGILNGVDTQEWNPAVDPCLARNYTLGDVTAGKAACKEQLQNELGLPARPDVPLLGMITRMTNQKGCDLVESCADDLLRRDVQLCLLGTGEESYEEAFRDLARRFPQKVSTTIGFSEELAHRIEAASDLFLMPSRFEPCGLNQMYSLIYGTVPIVREVGGLADSVVDATHENLNNGTATGFCFSDYSSEALAGCIGRALEMFQDRRRWQQLVETGMQQDWSWQKSAEQYEHVYRNALSKRSTEASGKR